jgi:excisionase family DNA binding protein
MATTALSRDARTLERSLAQPGEGQIEVSLSRETVEFVSRIVKAKASGQDVIITQGFEEVTPSQAATLLGMSRPQVRRMMDRGVLPFRMVGTHHRIRVSDLRAFDAAERERQEAAMARFTALENELGLTE